MGLFGAIADLDFIRKYGQYALAYPLLYMDGSPNFYVYYPFILFLLSLIGGIVLIVFTSNPKVDANGNKILDENGNTISDFSHPTTLQSIMKNTAYLLFIMSVFFLLFYGFRYWFSYTPEYYEWLAELPMEGKVELGMIGAMNRMESNTGHGRSHRLF